ncbi:MAG: hypothetical protein JXA52_05860 [Planctomycetes bacterium]|nr:hypothetical protein [Planctomycetota bacterium]
MPDEHDKEDKGYFHWWMIPLGVLLVLLIGFLCFRLSLSGQIEKRLEAIRAQGYPASFAELNAWYPATPPGENAAEIYEQAFRVQVSWRNDKHFEEWEKIRFFEQSEYPPAGNPFPPEIKAIMDGYLADNAAALKLFYEAAEKPGSRYPIESRNYSYYRGISGARESASLLALDALRYAEEGDSEKAARAIQAAYALSRSLRNIPLRDIQGSRYSLDEVMLVALEETLNRVALAEPDLEALSRMLAPEGESEAMLRALLGSRADTCDFILGFQESPDLIKELLKSRFMSHWLMNFDGSEEVVSALYRAGGLLQLEFNTYLDQMDEAIRITKLPPEARLDAVGPPPKMPPSASFFSLLSEYIWSINTHGMVRDDIVQIAGRRIAQVVIAVERYNLKHNRLPDSLPDLVPEFLSEVPLDPFDGKPIRYKPTPKGYLIYSVAWDRIDDGGKKSHRHNSFTFLDKDADRIFKVEREDLVE